jgi:hypothetical protein
MAFRLPVLPVVEVDLAAVDLDDHTYRISSSAVSPGLSHSIHHLGLLYSPVAKPRTRASVGWQIVAGFKRVHACRNLKWDAIPVRVLPEDATTQQCAQFAIADNALTRPLTVMERVRALALLRPHATDAGTLANMLPVLGMPESPAMIGKLERLGRQPVEIQQAVECERLSLAMALDLSNESRTSAVALCELFISLRLGLNRQRELLGLLRDISRRDDMAIVDIIDADAVQLIVNDSDSERPQIARRLVDHVKRLRYPRITAMETQRSSLIAGLELPAGVSLRPPPSHEDSTYTLIIQFNDIRQLKQKYNKLLHAVKHPNIVKLTEI